MKIDRLETHDRLLEFQKQSDNISKGCEECIRNRPKEFNNHPFYIFAHKRTIELDEKIARYNDDLIRASKSTTYIRKYLSPHDVADARLIWVPRLKKPKAQVNSMLFKAYPPTDNIRVIWIIPSEELWDQYSEDKIAQNRTVSESIHDFKNNRNKLEADEDDDVPEPVAKKIYEEIAKNSKPAT